ncbi:MULTISPECIES: S9 family peptidase [unclassified Pannonibacter]|uniref:alpha/beta hydrolase family protein n=1 Tax=unclassified Pannonibacter TaxID=2627228 RepID=UPI001FCBDB67|nr:MULTISPECIES: lipase family protein [unclassified Pannonibacter]
MKSLENAGPSTSTAAAAQASIPLPGLARRQFLAGAGASLAAVGTGIQPTWAQAAENTGMPGIDLSCSVTAQRLDAEVARAFPLFNTPAILPDFDAEKDGARHDVDLHRIVTHTIVPETGENLKVSGLLAVPAGVKGEIPLVSWQHGTILSFDQVPSNLTKLADPAYELTDAADSLETLFNIQRFAGRGFAVIAADYVGKGPFRDGRGEGYGVKDVTVRTCLDILEAGKTSMQSLGLTPSRLFLNGWSQGAINTQWLHQALQAQSTPAAAAAAASPFNDLNEAWSFWAGQLAFAPPAGTSSYPEVPNWVSLCMIIALGSYELQYGLPGLLQSAIRPEFHDMALKYWKTYDSNFDPAQPFPSASNLLVDGFFDRMTDDRNSAFLRHLAANRASYWPYETPIRLYYGLADEAIHPAMVYRALSAGGSQMAGIPVADASHRGTFLAGLYGGGSALAGTENVLDWFNSLA